jgi:hypothetical protein
MFKQNHILNFYKAVQGYTMLFSKQWIKLTRENSKFMIKSRNVRNQILCIAVSYLSTTTRHLAQSESSLFNLAIWFGPDQMSKTQRSGCHICKSLSTVEQYHHDDTALVDMHNNIILNGWTICALVSYSYFFQVVTEYIKWLYKLFRVLKEEGSTISMLSVCSCPLILTCAIDNSRMLWTDGPGALPFPVHFNSSSTISILNLWDINTTATVQWSIVQFCLMMGLA